MDYFRLLKLSATLWITACKPGVDLQGVLVAPSLTHPRPPTLKPFFDPLGEKVGDDGDTGFSIRGHLDIWTVGTRNQTAKRSTSPVTAGPGKKRLKCDVWLELEFCFHRTGSTSPSSLCFSFDSACSSSFHRVAAGASCLMMLSRMQLFEYLLRL